MFMKRVITATVMVSALLIASAAASGQGRRTKVDDYVEAEMAKRHMPGVALAVVRSGKVELKKGYGLANVEQKMPVTPDTVFQIASTTKPFTAMAIMILVEDGKISLDERAVKYLPWLPAVYSGITVRQILTHTSGVNRDVRTANVDNLTIEEFKRRFIDAPVSFKPGERWEYSSNGYILLGLIIESVTGKPYGQFLRERMFKPLGMKNTRYNEPPGSHRNRAIGYDWLDNTYKPSPYFHGGYAAGGLLSTLSDMVKWNAALDSEKLLQRASLEQMQMPAKLGDGREVNFTYRGEQTGYGFGWFLGNYRGHKLATHGGVLSGFSASIHHFVNDRITIIVLCNSKEGERRAGEDRMGQADALARDIADIYVPNLSKK
jgi:D-alanyl-D-alanine carboxypeptidase